MKKLSKSFLKISLFSIATFLVHENSYAQFSVPMGFGGSEPSVSTEPLKPSIDPAKKTIYEIVYDQSRTKCGMFFRVRYEPNWELAKTEADRGNPCAAFAIGSAMADGDKTNNNYPEGIRYLKIAESEDPSFGMMVFSALYVGDPRHNFPPAREEAYKFLMDAYRRGDAYSGIYVGRKYLVGDSPYIKQDIKGAIRVLTPLAEAGNSYAEWYLGELYMTGDAQGGVAQNLPLSLKFLRLAASHGADSAKSDADTVASVIMTKNFVEGVTKLYETAYEAGRLAAKYAPANGGNSGVGSGGSGYVSPASPNPPKTDLYTCFQAFSGNVGVNTSSGFQRSPFLSGDRGFGFC